MLSNKALLVVLCLFVIFSIVTRFYQYKIANDFYLYSHLSCNPVIESCFTLDCDPTDEECDTSTYKKVEIVAAIAPVCVIEHTCESFLCMDQESCTITYCADDTLEDGEICTVPPNDELNENHET